MKKWHCLLIICLLVKQVVHSQVAYYSATEIRDNYVNVNGSSFSFKADANSVRKISEYLKIHLPDSLRNNNLTSDQIFGLYSRNPFFGTEVARLIGGAEPFFSRLISQVTSSVGGLNVTNFADGLAKFMVKRFKEELNLAFFQKFRDEINEFEELKVLFPETHKLLMAIGTEIYRYNVYIITLREAFIKDLSNLYKNLDELFDLKKYKDVLKSNPLLKTILKTSLYLIDRLSRGTHAGHILAEFPVNDLDFNNTDLTDNIKGAINTGKLFSASLRSVSPDRFWVSADSVALLFKDAGNITFRIYLGLIYQTAKNESITFQNSKKITQILDSVAVHLNNLTEYRRFVETFIDKANEVDEYIVELKDKRKSEIDYNDYYNLFNASLDLIQHSFTFTDLPYVELFINSVEKESIAAKSEYWLFVARTAGEVFVDARTKNYSSAILNTVIILDTLFKDSKSIKTKILKYGTFMAAIAAAENSDDVAKAIEAVALPVGGSGIKKHSMFNIAIQSYLGGSYGSETIKELKTDQRKNVASIFAPVGISISLPLMTKKWKYPGSVSLVANILDLGALASFRLKDDSTAINSKIELRNILAPGLYFAIGLPKLPVSIGYGFQTGPQLREIKEGVPTIETKNIYTRSSFFIAVDMPLFNLYNKSK